MAESETPPVDAGFAASRSASAIPDIRRGPVADTVAWVPLGSAHNLAQLRFMAGARGQQKVRALRVAQKCRQDRPVFTAGGQRSRCATA